jgi:hypothetical protein
MKKYIFDINKPMPRRAEFLQEKVPIPKDAGRLFTYYIAPAPGINAHGIVFIIKAKDTLLKVLIKERGKFKVLDIAWWIGDQFVI